MDFRQHTTEKIYKSRINFKKIQNNEYHNIIRKQAEKIQEMAAVMQKAAEFGEDKCNVDDEALSKLATENKVHFQN